MQTTARAESSTPITDPTAGPCHDSTTVDGVRHPLLHLGLCTGITTDGWLGASTDARPWRFGGGQSKPLGGGGDLSIAITYAPTSSFAIGPLFSLRGASDGVDARVGLHMLVVDGAEPVGTHWDLALAVDLGADGAAECEGIYAQAGYALNLGIWHARGGGLALPSLLFAAWGSEPWHCRSSLGQGAVAPPRRDEMRIGGLVALAIRMS